MQCPPIEPLGRDVDIFGQMIVPAWWSVRSWQKSPDTHWLEDAIEEPRVSEVDVYSRPILVAKMDAVVHARSCFEERRGDAARVMTLGHGREGLGYRTVRARW